MIFLPILKFSEQTLLEAVLDLLMLSGLHIEVCVSQALHLVPRGQAQSVLMLELVLWGYRSAVAWILDLNPGDHWPIIVAMEVVSPLPLTVGGDTRLPSCSVMSCRLQSGFHPWNPRLQNHSSCLEWSKRGREQSI